MGLPNLLSASVGRVIELIVNRIVIDNRGGFSSNRILLIDLQKIVIEASNRIIVIEIFGAFCCGPLGSSAFGGSFGHADTGLCAAIGGVGGEIWSVVAKQNSFHRNCLCSAVFFAPFAPLFNCTIKENTGATRHSCYSCKYGCHGFKSDLPTVRILPRRGSGVQAGDRVIWK